MAEYGVIGRVLAHSWSPEIHAGLASYAYEKHELEPDELESFLARSDWRGYNVTIPYKKNVLAWAREIGPEAERLGAANTLTRLACGGYRADNTDLFGFAYMLERFCKRHLQSSDTLKGTKTLVLGSGGAAQAVVAALEDVGSRPVVISRQGKNTYDNVAELHSDATLIVNTTPVGMYPNCPDSPLSMDVLSALSNLKGVLDIVYNPEHTGIMLAAEKLGIPAESGLVMLVAQAWQASKIWTGAELDLALIDQIEERLLKRMRNVVLIGMPGSGKTTAGRELATLTSRTHIDLDHAFAQDFGKSAAEVIEQQGEDAFRALETQIAAKYGKESGLVISCGGGIVTRTENYDLMHQNATIVMLDRPLEKLSTKGRPVTAAKGNERLAKERMPLYTAWADLTQTCTGSARGDALEIAQLLGL